MMHQFSISEFPLGSNLLDTSIVLYGASGCGKTRATKAIMAALKDCIGQVIVVSPTNSSNKLYTSIVPDPLIHDDLQIVTSAKKRSSTLLEQIWKRQEAIVAIYQQVNNIDVLESLSKKLGPSRIIAQISELQRLVEEKMEENNTPELFMTLENCKKNKIEALKQHIRDNLEILSKDKTLSEKQSTCLKHLDIYPRLLLILDDCAADIKSIENTEVVRKMFYQNRHLFLTIIISCQDDTDLPANLRKNAFISIFCEPSVCRAAIQRGSNNFSQDIITKIRQSIEYVFINSTNTKLVYLRNDPTNKHVYRLSIPDCKPFRFGDCMLWKVCDNVSKTDDDVKINNQFYSLFKS